MNGLSPRELREIARANQSGRQPVVFLHGLWLLAESWDRWRRVFEERGYVTLAPGWPDEPDTVEEARRRPDLLAPWRIRQIIDHHAAVLKELVAAPVLIGHSFGGLFAQALAGEGLSAATVVIDPAPFRGVLSLPLSSLKVAMPVLRNPANYGRAVMLGFEDFRYGWANALDEDEARALYLRYLVPGPGAPLFQAAAANLNPRTEAKVETRNRNRGPLLFLAGERDHTVPLAVSRAAYRRQLRNPGITEIRELANRGHSLTIDGGWRELADIALSFVEWHRPVGRPHAVGPEAPPPPA